MGRVTYQLPGLNMSVQAAPLRLQAALDLKQASYDAGIV